MKYLSHKVWSSAFAFLSTSALAFGCSSGSGSGSGTQASIGSTQEEVMNSVCDCAMTARECFRGASGDAGRHECGSEFKTCEQNALAALKKLHDELVACEKDAGMCLHGTLDAGFGKAGQTEREGCFETERACVQAALPPPPPCIQGLETCVQNGGDRWTCLQQAFQCVRGANADAGR